jgi:hypothetical protein
MTAFLGFTEEAERAFKSRFKRKERPCRARALRVDERQNENGSKSKCKARFLAWLCHALGCFACATDDAPLRGACLVQDQKPDRRAALPRRAPHPRMSELISCA